jgi:hypothetical protein
MFVVGEVFVAGKAENAKAGQEQFQAEGRTS